MTKRFFAFAMAIGCASPAFAGDATVPFSMDSAGVLPKGVRSIRTTLISTSIENDFSNSGQVEGLAAEMNKTITYNDLAKSFSTMMDRATFKGYLVSKGIDPGTPVGETYGVINSQVTATVPVVAYGLTERWTLAVAVPVIHSEVNVDTAYTDNGQISNALKTLAADGKYAKVLENQPKLGNLIATQVEQKGYKDLQDQKKTQVGDVSLVAKYQAYKNERMALAVQQRVVLPTGKTVDINNIVDVAGGDGQFDYGVGGVADFHVIPKTTLTAMAGYLIQFPTTTARRIPESHDESLTSDIDSHVHMDLGDIASTSLGARYHLTEEFSFGASAALQYKMEDSYAGSQYGGDRYRYMEQDTEQVLTAGVASVGYSTVPLYMTKRAPVPLEFNASYASVFAGRNVKRNDVIAGELVVYF